jgi:hypothetical protein
MAPPYEKRRFRNSPYEKGHPQVALMIMEAPSALLAAVRLAGFPLIAAAARALLAAAVVARLLRLLASAMLAHSALLVLPAVLPVSHDSLLSLGLRIMKRTRRNGSNDRLFRVEGRLAPLKRPAVARPARRAK